MKKLEKKKRRSRAWSAAENRRFREALVWKTQIQTEVAPETSWVPHHYDKRPGVLVKDYMVECLAQRRILARRHPALPEFRCPFRGRGNYLLRFFPEKK